MAIFFLYLHVAEIGRDLSKVPFLLTMALEVRAWGVREEAQPPVYNSR